MYGMLPSDSETPRLDHLGVTSITRSGVEVEQVVHAQEGDARSIITSDRGVELSQKHHRQKQLQ